MLGQVGQPLLDLHRLGPDAMADQGLVVVGQVHERGEILPEPDGIDDRQPDLAGRHGREQARA